MTEDQKPNSRTQAILIIVCITLVANVLSDLALDWPESPQVAVQLLAAKVSAALFSFLALWGASNPTAKAILSETAGSKKEGEEGTGSSSPRKESVAEFVTNVGLRFKRSPPVT
jgi:hypothetical protein